MRSIFMPSTTEGTPEALVTKLKSNSLKKLRLEGRDGDAGFADILNALASNKSVKKVTAACSFNGDTIEAWENVFHNNKKIKAIDFMHGGLTPEFATRIGAAWAANSDTAIESIHLMYNSVGDEGAKALFEILTKPHCKLTEIVADQAEIGDEGVAFIVAAIVENNVKIQKAAFGGATGLTCAAAPLIADLIRSSSTLKFLTVENCFVGDEGLLQIGAALATNTTLDEFHGTSLERVTEDGQRGFLDAVKDNQQLIKLNCSWKSDALKDAATIFEEENQIRRGLTTRDKLEADKRMREAVQSMDPSVFGHYGFHH